MGHFAKVVNGKVTQVIVAEQDFINSGAVGDPDLWIQTSYNTKGGIHYGQDGKPDGGVALRGNYAGVGYSYDHIHDVFLPPKPYPSWTVNQTTWQWDAPTPMPEDGKPYTWDEPTKAWVELV